ILVVIFSSPSGEVISCSMLIVNAVLSNDSAALRASSYTSITVNSLAFSSSSSSSSSLSSSSTSVPSVFSSSSASALSSSALASSTGSAVSLQAASPKVKIDNNKTYNHFFKLFIPFVNIHTISTIQDCKSFINRLKILYYS